MRPKYHDFEGYGFDEHMVVSRARREKDRVAWRRLKDRDFAARHRESWDDDWDDDDFDDYDDDDDLDDYNESEFDASYSRMRS